MDPMADLIIDRELKLMITTYSDIAMFPKLVIRHLATPSTIQSTIQNEARIQSECVLGKWCRTSTLLSPLVFTSLSLECAPHSESWIESWMESRGDNYVG
eukprot:sb/3478684/